MTSRRAVLVLAAIASLPLACDGGCGGSGGGGAASATASAVPSAAASSAAATASAAPARLRPIRATGPAGPIFRAAAALDLSAEQRATFEKIGSDLRDAEKADAGDARANMKAMHDELVAGIKAGKLDTAKLDAFKAEMEKAAKAREEREADALNRLHAALDAGQRSKVVSTVRENEDKRAARMKMHERPDAGRAFAARSRLERFTKDLGLDAEQQKKVEALLPKDDGKWEAVREDAKKRLDALLAAFDKEGFDAKKLAGGDAKRAVSPFDEQAKFFGQILPILKPEQRDKLAAKLDRAGDDHGRGRGFRPFGNRDRDHDQDHEDDDE